MKNTFTFPHDYGARNDPELQRLLFKYGPAAGWAYWVVVEMLYEQGGRMPKESYCQVAYAAHVDEGLIQELIEGSALFKTDKKFFWSDRIEFTLENKEGKAGKSRTAAQAKWAKWRKNKELQKIIDTESMQTQSERSADAEQTLCHNNNSNNNSNIDILSTNVSNISCPTPAEKDAQLFGGGDNIPEEKGLTDAQCKAVMEYWNSTIEKTKATFSKVVSFSDERRNQVRIRWREFARVGEPREVCKTIFLKACYSNFLQGEGGKGWKADFDWIFKNGKNWPKIYEGTYDNKEAQAGSRGIGGFTERTLNGLQEIHDFFNPQEEYNGNENNGGLDNQS